MSSQNSGRNGTKVRWIRVCAPTVNRRQTTQDASFLCFSNTRLSYQSQPTTGTCSYNRLEGLYSEPGPQDLDDRVGG